MINNIAIVAHDQKKPVMAKFLKEHQHWYPGVNLMATGRTAEFLETNAIKVRHMSPGKSGGYVQLTELVRKKEIDMVIFFVDTAVKEPHHQDISNLIDACNELNVPLATNPASAELLIIGLIRMAAVKRNQKK